MKLANIFLSAVIIVLFAACSMESEEKQDTGNLHLNADSYGITGGIVAPIQGDVYAEQEENPFVEVKSEPVSTFSIDSDGASYSNVRRFIMQDHQLPPKGAVRTEELINYFDMDYPFEGSSHPVSLNGEISSCPWAPSHKLIRIGIKGKPVPKEELPASNFVFLIDVSGSMSSADRLELLKQGFKLFVSEMESDDRVAIVTYAGKAGIHLQSTAGTEKSKIIDAISTLTSGGSTAGGEGIQTAYKIAEENYISHGNNRVILGTDGDFNVGVSDKDELVKLIENERDKGVFLTILGVGRGNLKDASLEQIADNGNGNYEYIDGLDQMEKVFIHEFSKFYTVAKDVKVQVEFNPEVVHAYRLIGYENRLLNTEDFEDDTKDAGELGANQSITALYEIIPGTNFEDRTIPAIRIDFRYKHPDAFVSFPLQLEIFDEGNDFVDASPQMIFTSTIASFGMQLNDSKYKGTWTYDEVINQLESLAFPDPHGYVSEFKLVATTASGY